MSFLSWFVDTNKGRKEVTTPAGWHQVTLKQYIQLVNEWNGNDLVKLFSILSGLSVQALNDTFDPALYEQLEISTAFVYSPEEPIFKRAEKPKTITVNGKQLEVPPNLKGLSIGQSIRVREALDKTKKLDESTGKYYYSYEEIMPIALANYFQPIYDGTGYNDTRAKELLPHFENVTVMEGWALGFRLLKPLMNNGQTIGQRFSHLLTRLLSRSVQRELA